MGNLSRRKDRRMKNSAGVFNIKSTIYIAGAILALGIIAFLVTIMVYNNNLNKFYKDLETKEIGEVNREETENTNESEETSTKLGKTVEEMENEAKETATENEEVKETVNTESTEKKEESTETKTDTNLETKTNTNTETKKEETTKTNSTNKTTENKVEKKEEKKTETKQEVKELKFSMPVEGEIQKEYAKDKLVYSETLKEWVTHTGIDIKADKTTVVKSAEEGTVTAIKNDPRYGTTVIIEHSNGYETRYANLLTAEFVNIGEKVTKGQTIGTVGDTGSFEILDEAHLHFELLQNGEYQDPTSIIK